MLKNEYKDILMRVVKTFAVIGVLLVIIRLSQSLSHLTPEQILEYTNDNMLLVFCIVIALFVVKSVAFFIPIVGLYILSGALFGHNIAIVVNLVGLCTDLTLSFLWGKLLSKKAIDKISNKSQKIERLIEKSKNSTAMLFVLRASGLFPTEIISALYGSTGAKYVPYMIASLIPMLTTLIPVTLMGKAITNPLSKEFLIPLAISAFFLVVSVVGYKIYEKHIK